MGYQLQNGISFRRINDVVVVLNLVQNRYHALVGPAAAIICNLIEQSSPTIENGACIEMLVRRGILMESSDPGRIAPCEAMPASRSFVPSISPSLLQIVGVLASIHAVDLWIRVSGIYRVIMTIVAGSGVEPDRLADDRALTGIVTMFRDAELYLKRDGSCLPRSVALLLRLSRNHIRVQLFFGVALNPFRAHCWVEQDGIALNEDPDHIRNFVPIRVFEL